MPAFLSIFTHQANALFMDQKQHARLRWATLDSLSSISANCTFDDTNQLVFHGTVFREAINAAGPWCMWAGAKPVHKKLKKKGPFSN